MDISELYHLFQQSGAVTIDSRKVSPGSLFFAIKGERFDGNEFAAQALAQGARAAVVDNPGLAAGANYILVDDALKTLQELALHHRRTFDIPLLAITGSNGKTTTKELVSAVLGSHYALHFTPGNFNNHIGVPLTLLAMPRNVEIGVIEMGANHQGEIAHLCELAEPTHGLITNIGKAHLEGFGGVEGVKRGKSELYRYLAKHGGMVFINQDEKFLEELAQPVDKKLFYHRVEELGPQDVYGIQLTGTQPTVSVAFLDDEMKPLHLTSQLPGAFNFGNISTAIALGKYFKAPAAKIAEAIRSYVARNNRSQILKKGTNTYLLDSYNANPTSLKLALENFRDGEERPKVVILGDMLELGPYSREEHEQILRYVLQQDFDQVILVGPHFGEVAEGSDAICFEDVEALRRWMEAQHFQHTHFLIKGSRKLALERVIGK